MCTTACKKYPDGPLLSFETKMNRIAGIETKQWNVDYYSINGYDSTAYLQAQPYYGQYSFYSKKSKNPNGFFFSSNNSTDAASGDWKFVNNKEDLNILLTFHSPSFLQFNTNPYIGRDVTWKIRRLTDSDLWLKTTYNGKEYFMKLKH